MMFLSRTKLTSFRLVIISRCEDQTKTIEVLLVVGWLICMVERLGYCLSCSVTIIRLPTI